MILTFIASFNASFNSYGGPVLRLGSEQTYQKKWFIEVEKLYVELMEQVA